MQERTLTRLFRRFQSAGDGRALAAVFDATSRELFELACHLVREPAEAEDLVQATFLTAIRKCAHFDESAPLQAWLYGILWREAAKARRRAARAIDPLRLPDCGRVERDPLELAAEREVPAAVAQALARLPRAQREVLEPLLYEEKRADRIAHELARSPGTVRSQIHRGLEGLRRALGPRFATFGVLALPSRGLGAVRAAVLQTAGFSPTTAATAPLVTLGITIGGVLVSKSALTITAAALVAVLGGTWFVLESSSAGARPSSGANVLGELVAGPARGPAPGKGPALEANAPAIAAASASERSSAPAAAPAKPSLEEQVQYWLGRFAEAPDDWRHGWNVAEEIAKLPDDDALAIMSAVWSQLSVPVREQVLKPFVFDGGKPYALKILHLAATDATLSVQSRAFGYLKSYAFQDFALDYEAYRTWAARYDDQPLAAVLDENARRFVADLLALSPPELARQIVELDRLDLRAGAGAGVDLAAVMRDAGGLRLLEACLASSDADMRSRALRWSKTLQADERWLRAWALPAIEQPQEGESALTYASFDALARPDCVWARDSVLDYLGRATRTRMDATKGAGMALGEMGDVSAIPRMIELLLQDQTGELNYDVGYFGLAKLTGITWQKSYDAAWWLAWWEKNKARLPAEVAAIEIRR